MARMSMWRHQRDATAAYQGLWGESFYGLADHFGVRKDRGRGVDMSERDSLVRFLPERALELCLRHGLAKICADLIDLGPIRAQTRCKHA